MPSPSVSGRPHGAGALAANAVISNATLSLRVFLTSNEGGSADENANFKFYKVSSSWLEGTGTDQANRFFENGIVQPGSVSWLSREERILLWNTTGGDFDPA